MFYLILTVLLGSAQPSFAGVYKTEEACAAAANAYIANMREMNQEIKIFAMCAKTELDPRPQPKPDRNVL
jgi:hypothetical protein